MARLDILEARKQFTELDQRLRNDPILWITRHGKKAFAIVNLEHMEAILETLELLCDPGVLERLRASLVDTRAGRVHEHKQIKKEFL